MRWTDPIVEEVRQTRERLTQEAGGFESYIEKLRAAERSNPSRLLSKEDMKSNEVPEQTSN